MNSRELIKLLEEADPNGTSEVLIVNATMDGPILTPTLVESDHGRVKIDTW